jgi:hypothetical protein
LAGEIVSGEGAKFGILGRRVHLALCLKKRFEPEHKYRSNEMNQPLQVSFNSPQSGFMSMGLQAGRTSFVTAVAHSPYDSLRDLINALTAMLNGENSVMVKWNREPEEYDFELLRNGNDAELNIIRYPNHQRQTKKREVVFSHKATVANICESFWIALNELHSDKDVDEFDKNWRREFPEVEMRELATRIKSFESEVE